MNAYLYFVGSMHIYILLIMSGHVMGWALVRVGPCLDCRWAWALA